MAPDERPGVGPESAHESVPSLAAGQVRPPPRYGTPGPRLGRGPFLGAISASLGVVLVIAVALAVRRASTIVIVLVVATFLAVGLDRPVRAIVARGVRRGWALIIVIGTLVVATVAVILAIVPTFAREAGAFFAAVPGYVDDLLAKRPVSSLGTDTGLRAELDKLVTPENLDKLVGGVLAGVSTLAGALFFAITSAIIAVLLLVGLERISSGALRLVVASRRERVRLIASEVVDKISGYLVGAVLVAVCAGTAALLWTFLAGVPYPLMMAFVVAIFDMIPQVGATIGSTIVILVSLTESFSLGVASLIFFCCYQAFENWLVYPRVMSKVVRISAVAAIISTLIGGAIFGVLGVLLAVPTYASIQFIVREVVVPRQDRR